MAGAGAASEVTLWAVDYGVLSLTGFQPPDVAGEVYVRKALQVMGLTAEATLEEVKAKYKALVKQHHPDANGGDRSTEDRLIEIIKAYNYLKTVVRGA